MASFVIDTKGDASLAEQLPIPVPHDVFIAAGIMDTVPDGPVTEVQAEEFISLTPPSRKDRRKGRRKSHSKAVDKRSGRGRRRSHIPPKLLAGTAASQKFGQDSSGEDSVDIDPEEMAIMMDYIQNSSVKRNTSVNALPEPSLADLETAELEDMVLVSKLTGLPYPYDMDSDAEDTDDQETGLYEALTLGEDFSDGDEENETDSSDFEIALDRDDDDASLAMDGLDIGSSDDDEYLRRDFEGRRSTWADDDHRESNALEAKFRKVLHGDFDVQPRSFVGLSELEDSTGGVMSRTQKRKQAKLQRRHDRKAKLDKLKAQQAETSHVNRVLTRSKGRVDKHMFLYLRRINEELRSFVIDPDQKASIPLAAMPSSVRGAVTELAGRFGLKTKTRGDGKSRRSVVIRTERSRVPEGWSRLVEEIIPLVTTSPSTPRRSGGSGSSARPKLRGNTRPMSAQKPKRTGPPQGPDQQARPKIGSVVGQSAQPVSTSNIGHRMLLAMGWSPGQALGTEGTGLVDPVEVMVRSRRSGLGNAV
ncbi:hypothetical protein BC832DRAFT_548551 [Gaertneriomyces semiglobifer]|nr:hypothetical protein BC832DRAFT_548551 [Gaertneriomyces semiglobifer]